MSRLINLQGKKFSRLTVLSLKDSGTDKHARWNCVCDCGKKTISDGYTLRSGHTKSCGCLGAENRKKANTRHGQRQHCLYKTWIQMKQRCENKKDHGYKNYGGRGIKMCDQWHDFANFLRDMGDSFKPGLSIDRINNNYGYCKENC